MSTIGEAGRDPGDIAHRMAVIERRLDAMASARRLSSASVGSGGVRVHSGGGIRVEGGGDIAVADGGAVLVTDENGDPQVRMGPLTNGGYGLEQRVGASWVPLSAITGGEQFDGHGDTASDFSITVAGAGVKATATINPPAWANSGILIATANATIWNGNATGSDDVRLRVIIDGAGGGTSQSRIPVGTSDVLAASAQRDVAGSANVTITANVTAHSGRTIAGVPGWTQCNLDVIAVFGFQ